MKAIAAMSQNRVIGIGDKLPWHYSEDFKWFKKNTLDQDIIMGRITFQGLPGILPRRIHHVLTKDMSKMGFKGEVWLNPGSVKVHENFDNLPENGWVCGGAEIYEQLLPRCEEFLLTIIKEDIELTEDAVRMPEFEHLFEVKYEVVNETENCEFRIYKRI